MPANLPPPYVKAEAEFRKATTPAERLEKLREMFRLLPKHKGTEKLQADLKQKISRARDETESGKTVKRGGSSPRVPREGCGTLVLLGGPNVGKSALVAALTHAHPEVAAYPFTTRAPQPGMMAWEDVAVQLIDLPPITADFMEPWVPSFVRSADGALLVVDLDDDAGVDAAEAVLARLAATHTNLVGELPIDSGDESTIDVKTLVVANKRDAADSAVRLELLHEWLGGRFPVHEAAALGGEGLDALRRAAYDLLGLIRVYTKVPGKPVDRSRPFTVPIGSTVLDLAREIHRDLEHSLKFARLWGSAAFDGQTIKRDHELRDADIVEIHA